MSIFFINKKNVTNFHLRKFDDYLKLSETNCKKNYIIFILKYQIFTKRLICINCKAHKMIDNDIQKIQRPIEHPFIEDLEEKINYYKLSKRIQT